MQKLFKHIKTEVRKRVLSGKPPQEVYDELSAEYSEQDKDAAFMRCYIAKRVKVTPTPANRKEYRFSYLLYLFSLGMAVIVTIISKQHRIDILGVTSINSLPSLTAFLVINLYAWVYLYLLIRSVKYNLTYTYWALFFSGVDIIRLTILFPAQWPETPFFAVFRLLPPILVFLFGLFFALNCANPYKKTKQNGNITFFVSNKKVPLKIKNKRSKK